MWLKRIFIPGLMVAMLLTMMSGCAAPESSTAPLPTATPQPTPPTPVPTTPPAAPTAAASAWKEYRNDQFRFSIQYPEDWTVSEKKGEGVRAVFVFSAPSKADVELTVLNTGSQSAEQWLANQSDIPNTRCSLIQINNLKARRCIDTIAFATNTAILANQSVFVLSTNVWAPAGVYDRMLNSFRTTAP